MGLQKRALARAGVALLFLLTMANGPGLRAAASDTYTAVASGDWDNPATWGGVVPSAGVDISIPSGVAVILPPDLDVVIDHATLTIGGTLFVGGTLTLDRGGVGQILTGGELWFILGTLELNSGNVGVIADQARLTNAGKLVNSGGLIDVGVWTELVNSGTIYNDGEFVVSIRSEVHNQGMFENVGHVETRLISGSVAGVITSWFFNEGTFHNSDALAVVTVGGTFSNSNHVINRGTIIPFMIQRNVPDIGPYVLLAFLFAALPAVLAGLAYAILASAMPRAGGSYVYASRGLSPYLGFVASFSQWFALCIAIGVVSYVLVPFIRDIAVAAGWAGTAAALETGPVRLTISGIPKD